KTALLEGHEMAELSGKLIAIETALDLKLTMEELSYTLESNEELGQFLTELNFKSVLAKINSGSTHTEIKPSTIDYKVVKKQKEFDKLKEIIKGEDQIGIEAFFKEEGSYQLLNPYAVSLSTASKNFILYFEEFTFDELINF